MVNKLTQMSLDLLDLDSGYDNLGAYSKYHCVVIMVTAALVDASASSSLKLRYIFILIFYFFTYGSTYYL